MLKPRWYLLVMRSIIKPKMSGGQRILKPEKYMRQFPNIMPWHFQELQARMKSGPPLTENENRVYEALKVVLQELPVFAADNAYNAQPNASSLESIEHETKKRTNRTRKKDYVDTSLTKHISLIIDQEYESGLSLRKSGSAYLTPLESTMASL